MIHDGRVERCALAAASESLATAQRQALPYARLTWPWLAACVGAVIIAALLRSLFETNEDVSWLIIVAERVVGGARLYVDFLEVNPPASIFIYVPGVIFSALTGLNSVQANTTLLFGACLTGLFVCARSLHRADMVPRHAGLVLFGALVVLLAIPTYVFAEREHVVLLAILPALTTLSIRARGRSVDPASMVIAGIGAGLAVSIKPIFALGLLGPAVCVLVRQGCSPLARAGELWLGALLGSIYGFALLTLLPAFRERVLPIALSVYLPKRLPLPNLLSSPGLLVWLSAVLLAMWVTMRSRLPPSVAVLLTSSAGFAAAFVGQGKGFAYQCYPAIALALLAVLVGLADGWQVQNPFARIQAALLVMLGLCAANFLDRHYNPDDRTPGLRDAVLAVAAHPRMIAISDTLALGQPFTRRLGGTWVGSAPSTWISGNAEALIAEGADPRRFQPWIAMEQALYAEDIAAKRPDVVLVAGDRWQAWIDGSPALVRAMSDYMRSARFDDIALWIRKTPPDERMQVEP